MGFLGWIILPLTSYSTEEHFENIYWLIDPNGFWNALSWFGLEIWVDIKFCLFVFWDKINESSKLLRTMLSFSRLDFSEEVLYAKSYSLVGELIANIDDLVGISLSEKWWQADRNALRGKMMLEDLPFCTFLSEDVFVSCTHARGYPALKVITGK